MSGVKQRLGKAPCSKCGEPTQVFRHTGTDTLTQQCQECGWSCFAKKGEPCHGELMQELGAEPQTPHTKPATPAPAPNPQPAANSVFSLGKL